MSDAQPPPLTLFTLQNGLVESSADQTLVDAFAADFQGLRHFGSKIGDALDLGDPWSGMLQEADLTLGYAYSGQETGPKDPGTGGLVGSKSLLMELLTDITHPQTAEA